MEKEVVVKVAADTSGLAESMKQAQAAVKDSVSQMNTSLSSLGDAFMGVTKHLNALAAIIGSGAMFKAGVDESKKLTSEANQLARALGIGATEASTLNVALGDIYSSSEAFVGASQMLSRQLRTNEDSLNAMGLKTRDANGNLRSMKELMFDSLDVLRGYKEGTDRMLAAQTMFGRGGAEVMSMLKLNNDVLEQAKQKQQELGLIVGVENVEAAKQYKAAMNDVDDVMSAVRKAIGDAVMPVLTKLGEWFASIGPAAVTVIKGAIGGLTAAFWALKNGVVVVWETINAMVVTVAEPIRALGEAVGKALTGDFKGAAAAIDGIGKNVSEAWSKAMDEMLASSEETSSKIANLFKAPTVAGAKESKGKDFVDPKEKDDKKGKGVDQFSIWKAELEQKKEAEGAFFKDSIQEDEAYWQNKLQLVQGNGEKEKALRIKIQHEIFALEKQAAMQGRQLADEEIARLQKKGDDEISMRRQVLDRDLALDRITNQEKLRSELELLQEEQRLQIEAIDSKLELYDQDKVAHAKLIAQKEALERGYAKEVHKINTEILVDQKNQVQQWLGPVNNAIEKSVTGMIQGTTTLRAAMKNIFQSILGEFVSMLTKMLTKWVSTEIAKTTTSTEGAAARKVVDAGEAAVKATATTAAVASNEVLAQSSAGLAATNAMASVAAIPFYGWAMAPEVGASTYAIAEGFAVTAAASGGYDIPAGVNPVTQLHQEEMVLPANIANPLRENLAKGGGASGGDVHLHVHTQSTKDFKQFLEQNSQVMAPAIRRMARNFTPVKA